MEDVPLPKVKIGVGGLSQVADAVLRNESSSSGSVSISSSIEERGKGIAEDGYETGSDIDPE